MQTRTLPAGYKIKTRQDVRTLWYDVSFGGDHYASFDSRSAAEAYVFDEDGNETLGSCGCVDYHYADCPLRDSYRDDATEDDGDWR